MTSFIQHSMPIKPNSDDPQNGGCASADDDSAFSGPARIGADEAGALARVVAIDADRTWFEPMQGGSCGGCAAAGACGAKGIGTVANRLEARRFAVPGNFGLRVGDTVEVAFGNRNLVRAAAIAYVVPLFSALLCAALVQSAAGRDGLTMLGAVFGMLVGFIAMKIIASRLEAGGGLQARIVRRQEQPLHFFRSGAETDA